MAVNKWLGGADNVKQVDHLTPGGTIEADDVFNVTLADEAGVETTVPAVAGGTTVGDVCEAVQAACAGSSNALFQAITWTEDGSKVIATAKQGGVPFYCTVETTEDGGGAADDQTFVRSSSTANSGANDWNTAANWSEGSVPVADDEVVFSEGTYDVLYGLDQASIDLQSLKVGSGYHGSIGDVVNGFYLKIDVSNSSSATPNCVINTGGPSVMLDGAIDRMYVSRLGGGDDALKIGADSQITNLYLLGAHCAGEIEIADGAQVLSIYQLGAHSARTDIGKTGTVTLLEANAGRVDSQRQINTLHISGSALVRQKGTGSGAANTPTFVGRGGIFEFMGAGTFGGTKLEQYAGLVDLTKNLVPEATVGGTPKIFGGEFKDYGAATDYTYANDIEDYSGGTAKISVSSTVAPYV